MKKIAFYVLLGLFLFPTHLLLSQTWEEVRFEDFTNGTSGLPGIATFGFSSYSYYGATGFNDPCTRSSISNARYIAFSATLSSDYEYRFSWNLKATGSYAKITFYLTADPAGTDVALSNTLTIPSQSGTAPGTDYTSDVISGYDGTYYLKIRNSRSSSGGTKKIYADNFKLERRLIAPALEVSVKDSVLSVNEGDSVTVCLQINGSPTANVTADFALGTGASPHLDNYATQNITFPSGSSSDQCFTLATDPIDGVESGNQTYTFNLQNASGAQITNPDQLELTVNDQSPGACFSTNETYNICAGEIVDMGCPTAGSGNISYQWSPNTAFVNGTSATDPDPSVQPSTTTSYQLDVTNSQGTVIAQKTVQVNVSANSDAVVILPDTAIVPLGGTLDLTASVTGTGPFTYLWNTGATDSFITVAQSGAFSVTVTNAAGCDLSAYRNVSMETAPPPPASSASSTRLGPGDLVFVAFDNDIGSGVDRIVLVNLVPLEPGTEFMLTNARYCADDDRWYKNSSTLLNGDIVAQCISYQGSTVIPVGNLLCFDIPLSGDYLLTNFQVDGVASTDFVVSNCGHSNFPKLNLEPISSRQHLFLLQGRWNIFDTHADFIGRAIHGLNVSDYWNTPGSGCSQSKTQLPEDLLCLESPDFPRDGSLYAYFDCGSLAAQQSPYDFLKYISDVTNWEIENGTSALDLTGGGCSLNCTIVEDNLFWNQPPDTLFITCADVFADSIQNWLNADYSSLVTSSCGGPLMIGHEYMGQLDQACSPEGLNVTFTVSDTCGNYAYTEANIQLSNTQSPYILAQPADTLVNCTDLGALTATLEDWKARLGGTQLGNSCGIDQFETLETRVESQCGYIDYVDVIFQIITICNDTLTTNTARFDVQDTEAPGFTQAPQAETLDCNAADFQIRLKQWFDSAGDAKFEDNCSTVTVSANADPLTVSCGTTSVTFTITDACGNSSLANANLTITDNVAPTINLSTDTAYISLQHPDFANAIDTFLTIDHGGASASDACSDEEDILWSHDYTGTLSQTTCEATTVTLTATDECGNMSSASLVLVARDDTEPIFAGSPTDLSLDCTDADFTNRVDSIIMAHAGLSIVDPVSESLTWSYSLSKAIVPHCGSYPITYSVADGCGNSTDFETYFEVTDMVAPIFDTLATDLYVPHDDTLKYNYLFAWLADHGGARASDNCSNNLQWSNDPASWNIPDTSCWERTVTFSVSDGCNMTTTSARYVLYQSGIDTIQTGADLELTCCAADFNDIQQWLDEQADAQYTTLCGAELDWSYTGYDPADINICQDHVVTFTGTSAHGDTISFTQSILFTDSICCNGASVSLALINSGGQDVVKATPASCTTPIYTWRKDGQLLPQYIGGSIDEVPYDTLGAGQYEVEVSCNGEPCSVQTAAVFCDGFDVGLSCEAGVLSPANIINCTGDLSPIWYRDGIEVARDTDFYAIPNFGTYTMYASCNDHCVDSTSITLDCSDITLSMVRTGNQIEAIVPACYPYNPIVIWTINGKEIESYSGLLSIPYLGNGTYGVSISFPDNCSRSVSEYYCDSFTVDIVNEVSHLRANPTGCFTPHYQWFKLGETNPVAFNTETFTPTEAGSYRVDVSCGAACSATSTYVSWSPCIDVSLSQSGNDICASVSGTYCDGLSKTYTWFLDGVEQAQTTTNCFTPTQVGDYTVQVDCGACAAQSNTLTINQAACQISVHIGIVGGSQLSASVLGSGCENLTQTYTWMRNGVVVQQSTSSTYYPTQSGSFTVLVSCGDDPASVCEAQSSAVSFTVENCDLVADIQRDGDQLCAFVGGLDCQGLTETYTWMRYGLVVSSGSSNCFTPTQAGAYTVEVSCTDGSTVCSTTSGNYYFTIEDPCTLSIAISESDGVLSTTLTGSGCNGVSAIYTWYKDGVVAAQGPLSSIQPKEGGDYTVSVSCGNDPNNQCTASSAVYTFAHFCDGRSITIDTLTCTANDPNCIVASTSTAGFCDAGVFTWEALDTSATVYKEIGLESEQAIIRKEGCYEVSVTDVCSDFTCDVSTIVCFGGSALIRPASPVVSQQELSVFDLHLFPNPAKDEVFLQWNSEREQTAQVEVFDLGGNRIGLKQVEAVQGANRLRYSTTDLPAGLYLVRLSVKDGLLQKRLIIVQ